MARAEFEDIAETFEFLGFTHICGRSKKGTFKILRKTMRQMADGEEYTVPSTIEDASVLEDLKSLLSPRG